MDSLPVTLIVKAPNQQIEDQKIRCETSWTINKLKQHLSEVYPSKPPQHEQKLIYSGQLLNDSVILKDILRQYEGQDTHTVHLVCAPPLVNPKMINRARQVERRNSGDVAANPGNAAANSQPATARPSAPEVTTQPTTNNPRVPAAFPHERYPENGFPWTQYAEQTPQMNLNTLNQYQLQMALMQQAYMQYMTQYMQLASGQIPVSSPHPNPVPQPNVPVNAPNGQQNQPELAAQQNAPAQPQAENEERDWLDVFYMLSRAMVFFSVVYFYSSPLRCIFVVFLGVALYLYQAGFFNHININNNNNINGTPEGEPQEEQVPTRFMVAWTFISTFFASLIPEIRPNMNA
ncbi:homocysteine-responsive endoplasmic reticulum-resident ubiquitin-like domain member 2 protein [Dendroctonus ponderosae]